MVALRNNRLLSRIGFFCVALIFIGLAFHAGWRATHDLEWPYDYDFYRDAAIAQIILDGRFPADAYYAGEQNWYNPLSSAIVAGVARVSTLRPTEIYARCGAVIGLAIPFAIFALGVACFGRWAGLAGLFAFLFLTPKDVPTWAAPSYSPWLFSNLVSLVPFALTLVAALRARESGKWRTWVGCGALLGLTFLAHTAAAVVAGCVVLVLAWDRRRLRVVGMRWAIVLLLAFVVSAPLGVTILGHYGLRIKNPLEFVWDETSVSHLGAFLMGAINVGNAVALGGLVMLFHHRTARGVRDAFVTWIAVSTLMLSYEYARQVWPSAHLLGIVPAFHWLFLLRLARSLLLGYGLFCGIEAMISAVSRGKVRTPIPLAAILFILVLVNYKPFARRYDFTVAREIAQQYPAIPGFAETVKWLRRETPLDAVILSRPTDGLIVLGAAGRRAVVIEQQFSNPYVPYEPRLAAVNQMAAALAENQREIFLTAAAQYHVSYVLLGDPSPGFADQYLNVPFVSKVFEAGNYSVLQIKP